MHQTDRVKLQFGLMQNILEPPRCMKEHHKSSLRDHLDTLWASYYVEENKEWDERHNHLLDGEFLDGEVKPSHEYMVWFFRTPNHLFLMINNWSIHVNQETNIHHTLHHIIFWNCPPPPPTLAPHIDSAEKIRSLGILLCFCCCPLL
jgi:hypothetical protein